MSIVFHIAVAFTLFSMSVNVSAATTEPQFNDGCVPQRGMIGDLKPGDVKQIAWGDSTVYVYYRTEEDIRRLRDRLQVPLARSLTQVPPRRWSGGYAISNSKWARTGIRSRVDKYFVFWRHSPVYGCAVLHIPRASGTPPKNWEYLGINWPGGFLDLCYRVGFNYAGYVEYQPRDIDPKVRKDANNSLVVPPHRLIDGYEILLQCDDDS